MPKYGLSIKRFFDAHPQVVVRIDPTETQKFESCCF